MKKWLFLLNIAMFSFSINASDTWDEIEKKAKGQTVYFHAWGGSQEINNYLRWAARELQNNYGVTLKHVKISDVSESASRLLAEKTANKNENGSIDIVWINGKNFNAMKNNQLLFGPFVNQLPSWQYVDKSLPVDTDFSEPTLGLEAPWGISQLVFIHDKHSLNNPPQSFIELLSYSKAFPNRITYPKPPEFHGSSFLKAILIELTGNDPQLMLPVEQVDFSKMTQPLWQYLDQLHQTAWRRGKQFPLVNAQLLQLLDDDQIDLALTFNPNEVFSAQANGKLAETTQAYAMNIGALSNIHFLAIPWNASAKEGAQVAINFLLSPKAQSHKGDLNVWGDPSVLSPEYLTGSAKKTKLFQSVAELHPSWQIALEKEWLVRYGQ